MDFIKLFNEVSVVARPAHKGETAIVSLDEKFSDADLDSLDTLLIGIYMCEIYGISEEIGKTMKVSTPMEMYNFIEQNKTKEPESIEQAIKSIQ